MAVLSTSRALGLLMAKRELIQVVIKRKPGEEELILKKMYQEYRQENAKDLEREGCNTW
jgi:hypothetical protein